MVAAAGRALGTATTSSLNGISRFDRCAGGRRILERGRQVGASPERSASPLREERGKRGQKERGRGQGRSGVYLEGVLGLR